MPLQREGHRLENPHHGDMREMYDVPMLCPFWRHVRLLSNKPALLTFTKVKAMKSIPSREGKHSVGGVGPSVSDQIKRRALALGFQAVGISGVDEPDAERVARLSAWLARHYHGLMSWMAREPKRRADPREVLPGCRSVISLGMNYYTDHRADETPGHGRIARYAWGMDYHDVLLPRLRELTILIQDLLPDSACRYYVDTGPIMEKAWAQRAGLGWIGKHSNLVSPEFGSWLLLGEILTTATLEPDEPGADLCGSCTLCIQACPTAAITEPYVVDARRCISYLTIELRGSHPEIPDELAKKMGNRIFGCDDCLDICPYNMHASPTAEPAFQPRSFTLAPVLNHLSEMNAVTFSSHFGGSPIKRPKHDGFLRNVKIALRNWRTMRGSQQDSRLFGAKPPTM